MTSLRLLSLYLTRNTTAGAVGEALPLANETQTKLTDTL
jgi:hypothetical protein